jgi:hypothetical protein
MFAAVSAPTDEAASCVNALRDICALPGPTKDDTTNAEACGMLHLTTALIASRDGRADDATTHLAEARSLATYTGERNHLRYHFGPTNVAAWELGLAVETGAGPAVVERLAAAPIGLSVFGSKGRVAYAHFDIARAWAQADGRHDGEAVRKLEGEIELDPHAAGACVLRFDKQAAIAVRNAFTEWLG